MDLNSVITWTKNIFEPLGSLGLFILAFMESSFFPVPPDILLIILCVAEPEKSLFFALICTIGSVTGGMFGYLVGYGGKEAILKRFFSERKIAKVHNLFNKYEAWAVAIAGFTPIPYKVFTIAAGVFYVNFKKFVLASIIGRGLRFFMIAAMIMFFGEAIMNLIQTYFNWATVMITVAAFLAYVAYMKYVRKSSKIFFFF